MEQNSLTNFRKIFYKAVIIITILGSYSSIKSMRAVHGEAWKDPVRIANEYYIKLNFPGWKRSKQIRLKGWVQNRKKVSHNDLGFD